MLIGRRIGFICFLFFNSFRKEPVTIREILATPLLLKVEQGIGIGLVFKIQNIGREIKGEVLMIWRSHCY
ncbi:hypothetical protein BCS37_06105 [Selenomonas sp. oral taxon 920]|nr:hypothetical protein BCS37_06105 [Selenomonas sp. oral taxon 920]